jgi:pimeloyl-ACP methyl ester carboxylesterase
VIVLVHGVPETAAIWDRLRASTTRPSRALALPGFGCPRPEGFGATKDDYVAWVLDQLAAVEGPVDLVGHDWGAAITYRIATAHGDRIRSWAADVASVVRPDYRWHDVARIWQTPGEGEAFQAAFSARPPEERAATYEAQGVPAEDALVMARAGGEPMDGCILDLYRSALPNPHASWGPFARTTAPGLVVVPTEDPFSTVQDAREVAGGLGARLALLPGIGHFWPAQAPAEGAAVLDAFWATVD